MNLHVLTNQIRPEYLRSAKYLRTIVDDLGHESADDNGHSAEVILRAMECCDRYLDNLEVDQVEQEVGSIKAFLNGNFDISLPEELKQTLAPLAEVLRQNGTLDIFLDHLDSLIASNLVLRTTTDTRTYIKNSIREGEESAMMIGVTMIGSEINSRATDCLLLIGGISNLFDNISDATYDHKNQEIALVPSFRFYASATMILTFLLAKFAWLYPNKTNILRFIIKSFKWGEYQRKS